MQEGQKVMVTKDISESITRNTLAVIDGISKRLNYIELLLPLTGKKVVEYKYVDHLISMDRFFDDQCIKDRAMTSYERGRSIF